MDSGLGAARMTRWMALCVDAFDIKRMVAISEVEGPLPKGLALPKKSSEGAFS